MKMFSEINLFDDGARQNAFQFYRSWMPLAYLELGGNYHLLLLDEKFRKQMLNARAFVQNRENKGIDISV